MPRNDWPNLYNIYCYLKEVLRSKNLGSTFGSAGFYFRKVSSSHPDGLYQFKVMPFWLCSAPSTFQRFMDMVLAGLKWTDYFVYMDDVAVFGKDLPEHLATLAKFSFALARWTSNWTFDGEMLIWERATTDAMARSQQGPIRIIAAQSPRKFPILLFWTNYKMMTC